MRSVTASLVHAPLVIRNLPSDGWSAWSPITEEECVEACCGPGAPRVCLSHPSCKTGSVSVWMSQMPNLKQDHSWGNRLSGIFWFKPRRVSCVHSHTTSLLWSLSGSGSRWPQWFFFTLNQGQFKWKHRQLWYSFTPKCNNKNAHFSHVWLWIGSSSTHSDFLK